MFARRRDLVVSTRKMTEEAAQVGASQEWEDQRKEESAESSRYANAKTEVANEESDWTANGGRLYRSDD